MSLACPDLYKLIFQMSLACPDLYKLIFQTFYHTSLISSKQEIDKTVNFTNFCKFLTNKLSAFLWHFGTPFSNRKNERSDKACMKHAAMAVTCNYTLGKLINVSATRRYR